MSLKLLSTGVGYFDSIDTGAGGGVGVLDAPGTDSEGVDDEAAGDIGGFTAGADRPRGSSLMLGCMGGTVECFDSVGRIGLAAGKLSGLEAAGEYGLVTGRAAVVALEEVAPTGPLVSFGMLGLTGTEPPVRWMAVVLSGVVVALAGLTLLSTVDCGCGRLVVITRC